ncbi:hypothetical protein AAE02nite_07810 [Adhaeribacter aerolatus]|uniref:Uncharacterized protein n=1 Tax=Adhaeribacter aerolatus TaxID=670289 RepID=A0A512AU60_9BACT|nr:hypothetical protein [Adhaeribacter aerolatus]GEO03117.1 hypothetical protein AAE02nite_07810 [Adhaeribacter aerolatus]
MINNSSKGNLLNNHSLGVLSRALETSFWTNRKLNLPTSFQLEFDWTDLYFEPVNSFEAPNTAISIDFINPKSISLLSTKEHEEKEDLVEFLLKRENFSLDCREKYFTFTDNGLKKRIIAEMKSVITVHGYSPNENIFLVENCSLVFIAEDYGLAISAESIKLFACSVEVELNKIPEIYDKWVNYWATYCKLVDTKNPLPKDESFERRYFYGT